jgi:hypothetical protein
MSNSIFSKFFSRARTTDPTTSHQAAEAVKEYTVQKHFALIHNALVEHGPLGKDSIALHSGLDPNQVARRLPEMMKVNAVELTGRVVPSFSGRNEREWRAI